MNDLRKENFQYFFQQNATYLRRNEQYTQCHLAAMLELNIKTVAAIEEGRTVGLENLYKYSKFFNVTINDLITKKLKIK